MLLTRLQTLYAACFLFFGFLLSMTFLRMDFLPAPTLGETDTHAQEYQHILGSHDCRDALHIVKEQLRLGSNVSYAKTCIRAKHKTGLNTSATIAVDRPLFGSFAPIDDVYARCEASSPCENEITVEFARQPARIKAHASPFLFGVATTLERFDRSLKFMSRWLANSQTTILVKVHGEASNEDVEQAQARAREAGIDAILIKDSEAERQMDITALHFRIVKSMRERRAEHHKWFVIIDDDTFFTSLVAVEKALEPYDPALPWYIGALTESWPQIKIFGYMAYGGAGIFLSLPVVELLTDHLEECASAGDTGDGLFMKCLYNTVSPPVHLTTLPGLNQIDFRGNPDGWYESGRKPILSIHHYDGWHQIPLHYSHTIANLCGHDCFLQRYLFGDSVVLTNGYSAVQYPNGLEEVDLGRMENTFDAENGDYDFSFGTMRPKLGANDKKSWKLEYASQNGRGVVRQFYVDRGLDGEGPVQAVLELEWIAD